MRINDACSAISPRAALCRQAGRICSPKLKRDGYLLEENGRDAAVLVARSRVAAGGTPHQAQASLTVGASAGVSVSRVRMSAEQGAVSVIGRQIGVLQDVGAF